MSDLCSIQNLLCNLHFISAQRKSIDRLAPAVRSHYANVPPCLDGTRQQILNEIRMWSGNQTSSNKLLWIFGQAGLGKSSIAATLCRQYDKAGTLGSYFFCKRDDPELRSPEHVLNTIVHRLATRFQPYGKAVAHAIENNPQLPELPFEQRYTCLVEQPLNDLESNSCRPSSMLFLVVDALDECEKDGNRRTLLKCLRAMSQAIPWLKIILTSRPEPDIRKVFGNAEDPHVSSHDLLHYDALNDILEFTRSRMTGMVNDRATAWPDATIQLLSKRSGGLFIWVETACKFIEKGADMETRLDQILQGTQPAEGSAPLDLLYNTAIKMGMGDQAPDNMWNFRQCIGTIVATAGRTPLPITNLEILLSSILKKGTVSNVVNSLGSVLYEDADRGGAVRVYNPSFLDFIVDESRSKDFYVDMTEQDATLADCCLRTMMQELQFNICQLQTSHTLNRNVADLDTRIEQSIGRHLAYSCLHWSSHLGESPNSELKRLLSAFIYGRELLYWIETLSLLSKLDVALLSLLKLANQTTVSVL